MVDLEQSKELFADVQRSLDVNKSLPWALSIDALKASLQHIEEAVTLKFLDEYLLKVIHLMTNQSPSKLGTFERNVMEESILTTLKILMKTLAGHPCHFLVLARIFDASIPFYNGSKVAFTYSPGFPGVRLLMGRKFAEAEGFSVLLELFKNAEFEWPGGDHLITVLKMFNVVEILNLVDTSVKDELISVVIARMLALPDEQLKRENTDVMACLVQVVCNVCNNLAASGTPQAVDRFQTFWFENTLKLMNSKSLVMKLFAWDQVSDIILEAKATRPLAASYLVEGAGTAFANGVYTINPKHLGPQASSQDEVTYTKGEPGTPLLTLFRCTMRTKAKWWFISQADIEKPGTDKDIDYYLHKSSVEDEREPPSRGWTRVNAGINLIGLEPAPTLKRGELLLGQKTPADCFDQKLLAWCGVQNLLGYIFGPSIHREIIARSGKLLVFLTEYDFLSRVDLHLIWKAAMDSSEADIVEEVFLLLVPISPYLSVEMFAELIGLAQGALKQAENYPKIAQFVEKFAIESAKHVRALTEPATMQLLSLVWEVYIDGQFESLKSSMALQELLSMCLNQRGGQAMATQRILECAAALSRHTGTEKVSEAVVTRILHTLQFLVSKHTTAQTIEQLDKEGLPRTLINEIGRFAGRPLYPEFSAQLSDRLQILKKIYAIHPAMTIPFESIATLSGMLTRPLELDAFFLFLKSTTDVPAEALVGREDALKVFTSFICDQRVDWAQCGPGALACFTAYYSELEPVADAATLKLGLDTLWCIALNIAAPATHHAIQLLLQAYETLGESAYSDMLAIVFNHLDEAVRAGGGSLSEQDHVRVTRCVSILSSALVKSKGRADPAHAVRGTMFRLNVSVPYHRVTSYFNPTTQADVVRTEKGTEGVVTVELHPLHTIAQMKEKIAEKAELGDVTIQLEHAHRGLSDTSSRVGELGLVDGGELPVTYQLSYTRKNYDADLYAYDSVTVGQLISSDFNKFQCLLTLCELSTDPTLTKAIWQLLMLMPTQDMMLATMQGVCFPHESESDEGLPTQSKWHEVIRSFGPRTAYLLQIIDNTLQPAQITNSDTSAVFRDAFLATGGFAMVLGVLIATPSDSSIVHSTAQAVALHIMHYLLFGHEVSEEVESDVEVQQQEVEGGSSVEMRERAAQSATLLEQVEERSAEVMVKLLHVASTAAASNESRVVQDALKIITKLIRSPEAASQLSSNPQSQLFLSTVLRSDAFKVRRMASDFAVKVGRTQPVVFLWLLDLVRDMAPNAQNCSEVFRSLGRVFSNMPTEGGDCGPAAQLALILSEKLSAYPKGQVAGEERSVLQGCLDTLDLLITKDPLALQATPLGSDLVRCLLTEFLLPMPGEDQDDVNAICDTELTRRAAFDSLASFLSDSLEGFELVLSELNTLSRLAAKHMQGNWGLQVSHDVKKPEMKYAGLKNQGCTCYMNSLLQVLFMSTAFREAVLATPLLESHRTSLWHKPDLELVGGHYLFEQCNGSWRQGQIIGYDGMTARHRVLYVKHDGSMDEMAIFNIHDGRFQRETGRVRTAPREDEEAVGEREDAAYRVLEQLQRTFCFLKLSKRRFFDPVQFVEACKSLNLNFNVYHQNDAAEFCDQLLDRIETATKGKHTKKDMWQDAMMANVFGGKWLYQKIPRDCEVYTTEKEACGHWQGARLETFLKVELMIRGKEKVEDSLEELMQGELMDGDNKISCDVCTQKMATVRRTCFGDLPNTLVLHLKRFDLDFQTFETVKLNNRMAFPQRINMLEYSKEGIEAAEKRKEAEGGEREGERGEEGGVGTGAGVALAYETEGGVLDAADYEYELQAVLVHAGVAQGGHYYSYIREDVSSGEGTGAEGTDKGWDAGVGAGDAGGWYKFDDDEVSSFEPDQIPLQCFGGGQGGKGVHGMDEERTANALMLVYNKVNRAGRTGAGEGGKESPEVEAEATATTEVEELVVEVEAVEAPRVLVDGMQAFQREVRESNLQHTLSCYLLDHDLHAFVKNLLSSITTVTKSAPKAPTVAKSAMTPRWSPLDAPDDLPLRTVQFSVSFLLDVVLHCRERTPMRPFVHALRDAFETYPHTAVWFVTRVLDSGCHWFAEFTLTCSDALARATFVQVLVHAVSAIAPPGGHALRPFKSMKPAHISQAAVEGDRAALTALVVRLLLDHTFKAANHTRTADELFFLIRDLAALPCVACSLRDMGMLSFLAYFVMPEQVPQIVQSMFEKHLPARNTRPPEYGSLLQSVYDAMAALLGVPQLRRVALLEERSYWDSELVPDAREALTAVFNECAGLDAHGIERYFERVGGVKATQLHIRGMLDRFATNEGRLALEGFLEYHTDMASYNPKQVWRDLHAFGFRNDLSRATAQVAEPVVEGVESAGTEGTGTVGDTEDLAQSITENCRQCLSSIALYESGLSASEAATRAIARRACHGDIDLSKSLLRQALEKLLGVACENTWNHHPIVVINDFIRLLLSVDDGMQLDRLRELLLHPKLGIALVAYQEHLSPSSCRANEFNRFFLFERYVNFAQELLTVPGVGRGLEVLAGQDAAVRQLKGFLRTKPGYSLTENDDHIVRNTLVIVSHAGVVEINGEYLFKDVKCDAGYYSRRGSYQGAEVDFTLYKCSLKNGGFQWFISITPEGKEPGTSADTDFYYASAKPADNLPAPFWLRMNPDPTQVSRDPAPSVSCLRTDITEPIEERPTRTRSDSDSDKDSFMMVGDDTGEGEGDDSFDRSGYLE